MLGVCIATTGDHDLWPGLPVGGDNRISQVQSDIKSRLFLYFSEDIQAHQEPVYTCALSGSCVFTLR